MHRTTFAAVVLALLAGLSLAQVKSQEPTAASLIEQGKFAEEQERDFKKAETLYGNAVSAAMAAKDAEGAANANAALTRVKARAAGVQTGNPQDENDPMIGRLMDRLDTIARFGEGSAQMQAAYNDVAMFGAVAIPWLEKGIQGPIQLAHRNEITSEPPRFIRALAMMSAPEASASLERLLSSPDPIARRAVAQYADPLRHREILLHALKDPASAVREQAIERLSSCADASLFEMMLAAARAGSESALHWIGRQRPEPLLADAGNGSLSLTYRCAALNELQESTNYRPDRAAIDTMLALSRAPNENSLRRYAMSLLHHGVSESWKPIAPDLARQIEDALLPALDSYPSEWALDTLLNVGGARSLVPIIDRTATEDLGSAIGPITRILSRSGPSDFQHVIAAFARTSPPLRNSQGTLLDTVHGMLRGWLETMATGDISSADLARGAASLDSVLRRIYVERVVMPWIQNKIPPGASSAKIPPIDPGFVKLVRELALEGNPNSPGMLALGLSATGDPNVLPDLLKLVPTGEMDTTICMAIKRIVADDPTRMKALLELLLANKSISAQRLPDILRNTIGARPPAELLALANAFWGKVNSEKLMTLVAGTVPGPDGSAFLLAHYGDIDAASYETRINVIERFASEVYEPAKELIGSALRDPSSRVRQQASSAFDRFKLQQQVVDSFNEWMKSDAQGKQTIGELEQMLQSSNPDVVLGAVKALAAMKSRASYPKLIQVLEKYAGNPGIKSAVMKAIDDMGSDEGSGTPSAGPDKPAKSGK